MDRSLFDRSVHFFRIRSSYLTLIFTVTVCTLAL